jgi:hypothetical protein
MVWINIMIIQAIALLACDLLDLDQGPPWMASMQPLGGKRFIGSPRCAGELVKSSS